MPHHAIRTFIALELDAAVKEKIAATQSALKQTQTLKASWVAKNNFHLTIKFLGDTPKNKVASLSEALKECCDTMSAIDCRITATGVFPDNRFPRVVWVGIENGSEHLAGLAQKIEDALGGLGFKKEKREFKSHITIARVKNILDYQQFTASLQHINEAFSPIPFLATAITLFESTLTPNGPLYHGLAQCRLRSGV